MQTRGDLKRKMEELGDKDVCVICLAPIGACDAQFLAPCHHHFHVQCIETNVVVARDTRCPCCRAPWTNAPGMVALAKAAPVATRTTVEAPSPVVAPAPVTDVMPDVPPPAEAPPATGGPAVAPEIGEWCKLSAFTDVTEVPAGARVNVTALVRAEFADDHDDNPIVVPADFVVLADVSGSMAGTKIAAVKDTLLKVSDMFQRRDRVAFVTFNHTVTQLTPLAPLSVAEHEAELRRHAMMLQPAGGTDITAAVRMALQILTARTHRNPLAHILLLTDGQDKATYRALDGMLATYFESAGRPVLSAMGYGSDHDAELLATITSRGKGTFTYVDRMDVLDETFASYLGNATAVVATDVRVRVEGAAVSRVTGPGAVQQVASGAFEVLIPSGPVAAVMEILVHASTDVSELFTVSATGIRPGTEVRVATGNTEVKLRASPGDPEAIATARNRETVSAAAAAVASAIAACTPDMARAALAAAREQLVGDTGAREAASSELASLEDSIVHRSPAFAVGLNGELRTQNTMRIGSSSRRASKGATKSHRCMVSKKSASTR